MDALTAQERNRLLELLLSEDDANYIMAKTIVDQFLAEYPAYKHFNKKVKRALKEREEKDTWYYYGPDRNKNKKKRIINKIK